MQEKRTPGDSFESAGGALEKKPDRAKKPGKKVFSVRITQFLGVINIVVLLMVFVIAHLVLVEVDSVSQTARGVREKRLPELMENQRSSINTESLRRIAEIAYISTTPEVRRLARINAQSLAAEFPFENGKEDHSRLTEIAGKIIEIANIRDVSSEKYGELQALSEEYYTNLQAILNEIGNRETANKIYDAFFHSNISNLNTFSTPLMNWEELEKNQEKDNELISLVSSACTGLSTTPAACGRINQVYEKYVETQQFMFLDFMEVREKWMNVDKDLEKFRESLRTNAELNTNIALVSIEQASEDAREKFFYLFIGGIVFVLVCMLLIRRYIVIPVRWAAASLKKLQKGDLRVEAPDIHIKELCEIADLLENFSSYISGLYMRTSQLAGDSAGKRDLEEVMRVVFMASLDGYSIWDEEGPVEVSSGLLNMLGLERKEQLIENWRTYDLATEEARREKYRRARENGYWREEVVVPTASGERLPLEVTYLPISFKGKQMTLRYTRDLRKQKQTEIELRKASQEAEIAAQAKSDFLARMSHEIRTPMNGVLGLTHLALESNPPPEQKEYLEKIRASARILLGVINDILDFSKMEEDKIVLANEPFSLNEMISTVKDLFLSQAKAKGLDFKVKVNRGVPDILTGDSLRLSQVLLNLCSNAVKFTSRGKVSLQIRKLSESEDKVKLKFSVVDSGVGLSDEDIGKVFQPFSQIHKYSTRQAGGTGLGLVISKRIVALMGGELLVKSIADVGSNFSFTLTFVKGGMGDNGGVCEQADDGTSLKDVRVLLVEDNQINQEIAQALLLGMGAKVTIASNGQESLDILADQDFDIVLMDIQMPVMDGLTATELVRSEGRAQIRNIPIIAMTAHVMEEDREKSYKAGMNEHITKPVDVSELRNKILKCLSGKCK